MLLLLKRLFLLSPSQFKQLIPQIKALKAVIYPAYQAEVDIIHYRRLAIGHTR
jgi:hypothetical protein